MINLLSLLLGKIGMSEKQIESKAFQRAVLKSESYRIFGLLVLLGVLLVFTVARTLAVGNLRLLAAETLLLALAIAYEAWMLKIVKRALENEERDISPSMRLLNLIIETQIPTLALIVLIRNQLMNPFQALVAPAMLAYFFFIILSTLRLSPTLSVLTGALSAAGYLAAVFYTVINYPSAGNAAEFSTAVYFIYAGVIFASGVVAAFVAGQIRNHVAAALREADLQKELERVNHDLDIARSIQQDLLPSASPSLENFEIAGWNQPADQTGGDFYDWQELPDGRIAVSLADATGHGIGPALVGTSCRAYARASFLAGGEERDGALLGHLNQLLAEDLDTNRFVTFAVIFLEPESANVKILSAGHGPILWYQRAADKIENLDAHGIPLGMMAGVPYSQGTEGSLAAGDILAMITDGFYEWENPEGEQFGIAGLEAVLRESRDLSAEEIIIKLREAVADFCRGTKQMDDLTAVIVKRKTTTLKIKKSDDMKPALATERQTNKPVKTPATTAAQTS
jgi:serine phosphatase RsbU (regulator of sigma subunit)